MVDYGQMIEFHDKNKQTNNNQDIQNVLGMALIRLIDILERDITEYSKRELNNDSGLIPFNIKLNRIIEYRKQNKRHLKNNYSKLLSKIIDSITRTIQFNSYNSDIENLSNFDKLKRGRLKL